LGQSEEAYGHILKRELGPRSAVKSVIDRSSDRPQ
jgi:hypothetical protein